MLGQAYCTKNINTNTSACYKMDKKRLRVALKILKEVTVKFPNTKQFIDNAMEEECQKERITADEVILHRSRSKELA